MENDSSVAILLGNANGTFTAKFSSSVGGSVAITATINAATFTFGAPITVCANPTSSSTCFCNSMSTRA